MGVSIKNGSLKIGINIIKWTAQDRELPENLCKCSIENLCYEHTVLSDLWATIPETVHNNSPLASVHANGSSAIISQCIFPIIE